MTLTIPMGRAALVRRVRLLVAATIAYNVIEAVVALIAGTLASSTALIGFGLDSVIEVSSAAAVAWQFSGPDHEKRERGACGSSPSRFSRWPSTLASNPSTPCCPGTARMTQWSASGSPRCRWP